MSMFKAVHKSADNRRRIGHEKCSLPLYLLPLFEGHGFRLLRGGGGGGGGTTPFFCGLCGTQLRKNIGVFDSPRVRFCILSTSWATSPASSASVPAKDVDDASDASDAGDVVKEHLEMKENAWK